MVELTVVDADTRLGLADVDLWRSAARIPPVPGRGALDATQYTYRSWEVEKRLVHGEYPRSNTSGVLRAPFEPGRHRIGVGKFHLPKGYEVVEIDGQEVDCPVGETTRLTFHLRKRIEKGDKAP